MDQYSTMKRAVSYDKVFAFEVRLLLFVLVICFSLPPDLLAASLNNPKNNERTTNEGYVFNNVYNSGLSTSHAQENLKWLKAVEQKLNEVHWKGPSKGKIHCLKSSCMARVLNLHCFHSRSLVLEKSSAYLGGVWEGRGGGRLEMRRVGTARKSVQQIYGRPKYRGQVKRYFPDSGKEGRPPPPTRAHPLPVTYKTRVSTATSVIVSLYKVRYI